MRAHLLALGLLFLASGCIERPKRNVAFYVNLGGEPATLNPITSQDGYSSEVQNYVLESLLTRDLDTFEFKPNLATEWTVAADKTSFLFKLREGVTWQDGRPLTAEDVKFSFDVIFSDKWATAHLRPYFEGIKEVQIVDDHTVKFIAKDQYYKNFDIAAGMTILPKHFYEAGHEKSFYNKNLVGTGPYKLALYKRGHRVVLEKNEDWWGYKIPDQQEWNFKKLVLRFVKERNVSMEMMNKGTLDFQGLTADEYEKKATKGNWGKSVHKVLTQNNSPKGYNFIGWNFKNPILKSKNVRRALSHLLNRELFVEKFEYNYSVPAAGPIYPESPYHDQSIEAVKYNPKKGLQMLRDEGWEDSDRDGILDKIIDGKKVKFSITIMDPSEYMSKYMTVFKEDAKKVGVEINIKIIEWTSFIKLLDERKFDGVRLAWGAQVDWDPKQIWHSSSIDGGSNFISYSNPDVDRLTDQARQIHDRADRIKILRKVERMIVDDAPYIWFTYKNKTMYGVADRIKRDRDTRNYSIGSSYWSFKNELRENL